jgi:hypothetical protein
MGMELSKQVYEKPNHRDEFQALLSLRAAFQCNLSVKREKDQELNKQAMELGMKC